MLRAVAVAGVLLASRPAQSSPARIEITGGECDARVLEDEIAGAATASQSAVHVHLATEADDGGVRAQLVVDDDDGHSRGPRLVTAATCSELASSVAVIVAMVIEDFASSPPAPRAPVPVHTFEGQHLDDPLLGDRIEVPPRGARERELALGVGASAALGGTHAPRLVLGGRLRRAAHSIGLDLETGSPDRVEVTADGRIEIARAELTVTPCRHLGSFAACGSTTVGVVRGSAAGLYAMRTVYAPSVAGGLRVTWERWYRQVGVRVQLDGRAFLTTTQFEVDYMPVWNSERFEASAGFGVLARFL